MASDASDKAKMEKLFSIEGGEQLSSGAGAIAGGSRCECPRCHGFGDERVGLLDKTLPLKVGGGVVCLVGVLAVCLYMS
jgi:hypothetical protein